MLLKACATSTLFKKRLAESELPDGFEVIVEPWPYGGPDTNEEDRRYFQGLCFAQDTRSGNPDSNYYPYPLPLIPVLDYYKREIIRVDRLATGGKQDGLADITHPKRVVDHCQSSEYIPELLPGGVRKDLKALNVVQPDGPSFQITDDSLVEWQKWRFRVGFNPREGATIHDVHYAGRSILYRLSVSEMVRTACLVACQKTVVLTNLGPFHTPTLDPPFSESKLSTLETAAQDTAQTASNKVATA